MYRKTQLFEWNFKVVISCSDIEKLLNLLFTEERPVVCVSEESNLLEAFKTIMRSGVTGVGVVNKKGELIGCVSAADLKVSNSDINPLTNVVRQVLQLDRILQDPQRTPSRFPCNERQEDCSFRPP